MSATRPDPEGIRPHPEGIRPDPEGIRPDPEGIRSDPEGIRSDPEGSRPDPEGSRALPSKEQVHAAAAAFAMLADSTRLQILWLVSTEELDVTTLASLVGANSPAVSQHLAKLRLSGLVDTHKVGRHVFYRARDTHVRALITEALFHADHHLSGLADHP